MKHRASGRFNGIQRGFLWRAVRDALRFRRRGFQHLRAVAAIYWNRLFSHEPRWSLMVFRPKKLCFECESVVDLEGDELTQWQAKFDAREAKA